MEFWKIEIGNQWLKIISWPFMVTGAKATDTLNMSLIDRQWRKILWKWYSDYIKC